MIRAIAFALLAGAVLPAAAADEFRLQAERQYRALLEQHRLHAQLDSGEVAARVHRVFARLVGAVPPDRRDWAWEAHVTSDPSTTAFSIAGGKLLVGARYVERLRLDDGELAMLLAHEMAHVIAGHVRRRASADSGDPAEEVHEAQLAMGQELEADDAGIALALRAGYKAENLMRFFDELAMAEPAGTFSASHPSARARAARARERLGEASGPK